MMKFLRIIFFAFPFLICTCQSSTQKSTRIDPDDTVKGRIVEQMYADSTPRKISIYEVDAQGKPTNQLKREVYYYKDKQKYIEGNFNQNQRNGLWQAYFKDGKVQSKMYYIDGVAHGEKVVYRENGNKYYEGQYEQGICSGVWNFYTEDGTLVRSIVTSDTVGIPGCGCPKCEFLKKTK